MDGPALLDLEGHGIAPVGYDAATLYLYAPLAPRTAAHIWRAFPVLDTPDGDTALRGSPRICSSPETGVTIRTS
ncbi:hypothetical protein GCM10010329_62700 [Streptomyces spiroverticillatus]|nr:hypothetical protein GCM10010329_62700 [Streptomyces spiroverticillatus]